MITETDLLKLRYKVITRLEDTDHTIELIHEDLPKNGYLVKLRKGEVQTIISPDLKKSGWKTTSLQELKEWHELYLRIAELI